jgi:hypothetical protein
MHLSRENFNYQILGLLQNGKVPCKVPLPLFENACTLCYCEIEPEI